METTKRQRDEPVGRIVVTGELSRQTIEAIRLEVRRLGRQHGFEVRESRGAEQPS
jgi:hypothetical protein